MTQPKVKSEWALRYVQAQNNKDAGRPKGSLLTQTDFRPVVGNEYEIEDAPSIADLDHSKNFGFVFSSDQHQVGFQIAGKLGGFAGWIVEMGRAGYSSDSWTVEGVTNSFSNDLHYFVVTMSIRYRTGRVKFYR